MLCEKKKLKSSVIIATCFLLAGAIFPGNLFAETITEEWVATYNGPGDVVEYAEAIAIDAAGNIYVTGCSREISNTWSDIVTIKYDSSGNELWVARYDGPVNKSDYARAMAVDAAGNVYVTGYCWVSYATDIVTIKYDTDGNELWAKTYNGPGNHFDQGEAIAVDAAGNVYVAGEGHGSGTSLDCTTIKYDSSGNVLWVARYNGPGNDAEWASAMALDAAGNIYVAAGSRIGDGSVVRDYATIKYDSSGNEQWVARYDGPANQDDSPSAIALDAEGNVYVTGESRGIDTGPDYATIKYDPNGSQLWVARYYYQDPGSHADYAHAMALDDEGNVYVTGKSMGSSTTRYDYATVKYDSSGNELWVVRYNGPGDYPADDSPSAIAVDALGNICVTGGSRGSETELDCATIKYDSSGNELWVARYNGPENHNDSPHDMALDPKGNVYVTGQSYNHDVLFYEYFTIKYSQDPAKVIEELISTVISLNLQHGISNSLDAKLGAALNALDDVNTNNDAAAINTLEAFINAVEAQRGGWISEPDADALINAAVNIINMLSGP